MNHVFAIIGAPGTGKSHLMKEWMSRWTWDYHRTGLVDHYVSGDLIVLGKYPDGETFGGTDRLSMSVQPEALEFVKSQEDKIILYEGDRLTSRSFFNDIIEAGIGLTIIALDCPQDIREERYKERGSEQNETWLAGRVKKVENIIEEFGETQTLFGTSEGHVVNFTHHSPVCTDVISDWIQNEIDEIILDSVVAGI